MSTKEKVPLSPMAAALSRTFHLLGEQGLNFLTHLLQDIGGIFECLQNLYNFQELPFDEPLTLYKSKHAFLSLLSRCPQAKWERQTSKQWEIGFDGGNRKVLWECIGIGERPRLYCCIEYSRTQRLKTTVTIYCLTELLCVRNLGVA